MLKDVFGQLDYSLYQQIAMLILALSFLAISWGAFRLGRDAAAQFGSIPMDDPESIKSQASSCSSTEHAERSNGETK